MGKERVNTVRRVGLVVVTMVVALVVDGGVGLGYLESRKLASERRARVR